MFLLDSSTPEPTAPVSSAGALLRALARTPALIDRTGSLAAEVAAALAGTSTLDPVKGDKRFADPAWSSNPVYRRIGQAYLVVERAINEAVESADVDWRTRERARFAAGILASALAPTNTLAGNPTALKHAFDTGGMSLVRGARNLMSDLRHNRGMPRQVDSSPFQVGENVGATPGQVVFRNEVLEIIQYTPTTPEVQSVPLLVVWSVINRYYVLDLARDRSFIEYALGQGIQVFVTSWRNPSQEHGDWNLDTYAQALLDALDAVREISGSEKVGTVGLCAGGQLLAATMAHLEGIGDDRIAYAGFGVSQIDMSVPNVAGLALHPALNGAARVATEAAGVVDGRAIASIFSWLRPNELVWNQWVNNYLMGSAPPQFDILAWNNDTTRVSGALQRDMLEIALNNHLATPGGLTVLGTPVDLGRVTSTRTSWVRRPTTSSRGRARTGRRSSSAATPRSSSRAAGTSSTSSTRPATRRRTIGPARSRARSPSAGSPERPSTRAPGGRTGRSGRWPGPATRAPLRRRWAARRTRRSRRPRDAT